MLAGPQWANYMLEVAGLYPAEAFPPPPESMTKNARAEPDRKDTARKGHWRKGVWPTGFCSGTERHGAPADRSDTHPDELRAPLPLVNLKT